MTVTLSERSAAHIDGELAQMRAAIEDLLGDRCTVEILGGEIIVSPMPRNLHMLIVTAVRRMLDDGCDRAAHIVTERVELFVDKHNSPQPDVAVLNRRIVERDLNATVSAADQALLVVEVTSPSNGSDDRKWGMKYKAYAKGMVPIYLLVDPHAATGPSLTLYTKPTGTRYQAEETVPFGGKLTLPTPFDQVTIDSASFPVTTKDGD